MVSDEDEQVYGGDDNSGLEGAHGTLLGRTRWFPTDDESAEALFHPRGRSVAFSKRNPRTSAPLDRFATMERRIP